MVRSMTCLSHGVESLGGEGVLSKVGVVGGQLKDGVFSICTIGALEGEWARLLGSII